MSARMTRTFGLAVAGGGTGGHIFPGLAVAREFRRRDPATRVLYLGVAGRLEERVVPREQMTFHGLRVSGIKGQGPAGAIRGALLALRAVAECRRVLAAFGANLLLGVGGYSSGPAAVAARSLGVPVVIQEQNTIPGVTNRILGHLARRVFIAFEPARRHFPARTVFLAGNPVRDEALGEISPVGERPELRILVLGGSQGARGVNALVPAAAARLAAEAVAARFVHQSGDAEREAVAEAYRRAGAAAEVHAFLDPMGERYAAADLVVARAGAGTVAEIAANGRPAILVPYPHAAAHHQHANAGWLVSAGGALLVEETAPDAPVALARAVAGLAADRGRLRAMAAASRRVGVRDAAARIVDECQSLLGKQERGGACSSGG
jgi:UDP-N-acetylglucosamine--N-acetylmuramyl-(pentapeptide) pyrophosphoryl-undecaprenol N-acetylglucosamine transferase